ncbi:MAG TPA: oxidoreductase [Actinophytocola sp.]|uniref:oxidoreductase n=1 Tax=Actinophytocola sp. TaxID=1872138 RepID=UPI002DDCEAAF|nr:oxidoreductase [Actinophytocola sp.]HEV2780756.1 oxidoreductase [Actinophytocola sp.]
MGVFDSLRRKRRAGTVRGATKGDTAHLDQWAAQRRGVEAYVEPRTHVTETTVLLVAHDGEWTRRRVASQEAAFDFARKRGMPIYEVERVGYPKRMREYQERQKRRGGSAG